MKYSNAGANANADCLCRSSNGDACPCSSTTVVARYGDLVAQSPLMLDLAALKGFSVQAAPVMALSTTSAVRAAVLAGAGAAVLSAPAVTVDLTTGRLAAIDVPRHDLRRTLRAVWGRAWRPARCSSARPAESHHLSGSKRMVTGNPSR